MLRRLPSMTLFACLGLLLAGGSALAEIQKDFTFTGRTLTVTDMIGEVEVVPASGTDFTVTVTVRGADAAEDLLRFQQTEGDDASLTIRFPVDRYDEYVYPPLGSRGKTTISYRDDNAACTNESWLKRIFRSITCKRVTVRGRGDGLEVWADVTIAVPDGADLKVVDRVGQVRAKDVRADLNLDTSRGAIFAADIEGDLTADTGGGAVEVDRVRGKVVIDTGSGSVTATDVTGPVLDADTGSGSVELKNIAARRIRVDTGSGGVAVDGAECEKLDIDTGSGGVDARGIGADRLIIDTGSGSVDLVLDRMGAGRFEVDTGSGSITLRMPPGASARVSAETGSGSIRNRLDGAEILHKGRGELEFKVGGGRSEVILDAGSGTVTIE